MSRTSQQLLPQLEDIPELETDKENWDDGQYDDAELLYNHNSTEESDRICCKYSAYLKKLKTKNTALTILCKESNTTFLNQIITTPIHNQNSTRDSKTKTYTYPYLPLLKTYVHGMVEVEEEPSISNYMATDCMVNKQGCWKAN